MRTRHGGSSLVGHRLLPQTDLLRQSVCAAGVAEGVFNTGHLSGKTHPAVSAMLPSRCWVVLLSLAGSIRAAHFSQHTSPTLCLGDLQCPFQLVVHVHIGNDLSVSDAMLILQEHWQAGALESVSNKGHTNTPSFRRGWLHVKGVQSGPRLFGCA